MPLVSLQESLLHNITMRNVCPPPRVPTECLSQGGQVGTKCGGARLLQTSCEMSPHSGLDRL